MNIDYAAQTDPGQRRTENQDSVLARIDPSSGRYLFAVADGVGGLAGGAAASRTTVEVIGRGFERSNGFPTADDLLSSVLEANRQILASRLAGRDGPSASTIVALRLADATFATAHVGDSRAYLRREGALARLTEDHSLIHDQVRSGIITEAEALVSRQRHVITRSLGANPHVKVEQRPPESLRAGDVFLLCSDGLTDVVSDPEIDGILATTAASHATADRLVRLANSRGGPDNISVIVVRVTE